MAGPEGSFLADEGRAREGGDVEGFAVVEVGGDGVGGVADEMDDGIEVGGVEGVSFDEGGVWGFELRDGSGEVGGIGFGVEDVAGVEVSGVKEEVAQEGIA
ncbi:MAG: hypothetical protein AADX95_22215 [Thiocapsa sp. N5-Cardenillas]